MRMKEQQELEHLQALVNKTSLEISRLSGEAKQAKVEEMKPVSERIKQLKAIIREQPKEERGRNTSRPDVPIGTSEKDNVVVKEWWPKRTYFWEDIPWYKRQLVRIFGRRIL